MIIHLSKIENETESEEEVIYRLLRKKRQLKQHLFRLKGTLPLTLNDAFDRYFESEPLAYLRIEDKLDHLASLFEVLEKQIRTSGCSSDLCQVGGRISFVADRLDEIEATLYRRPLRRRLHAFNLSDFFEYAAKQSGNESSHGNQEIATLSEAYKLLDLKEGCSLSELSVAFRRLARKHHPDARGGDRSNEQDFRRALEAYQMIKELKNSV